MATSQLLPECTRDPEGLALLEQCRNNVGEVAPRLILTDWLEEQGEFDVANCWRRSVNEPESILDFPSVVQQRWWPINSCYRGWLACEVVDTEHLPVSELDQLIDNPWFTGMIFESDRELQSRIEPYFNHPAFQQVICIETGGVWPDIMPNQSVNPYSNLQHVSIGSNSIVKSPLDGLSVCDDRRITRLHSLELNNSDAAADFYGHLGATSWFRDLQELTVGYISNHESREALWKSLLNLRFSKLQKLNINFTLMPKQIEELITFPVWGNLHELTIDDANFSSESAIQLLSQLSASTFRKLSLSGRSLSDDFGSQFVKLPIFRQLTELQLSGSNLSHKTLQEIVKFPYSHSLNKLTISINLKGYYNLSQLDIELAQSKLKEFRLHISRCPLPMLRGLVNSAMMKKVTHLSLFNTHLELQQLQELLSASEWHIQNLNLKNCKIASDGLRLLAQSPHLRTIKSLNLEGNLIDTCGLEALTNSSHVQELEELVLTRNQLMDDGMKVLSKAPWLKNIRRLMVSECGLTSEGVYTLFAADLPKLTEVGIWQNLLEDIQLDISRFKDLLPQLSRIIKSFNRAELQTIRQHLDFSRTKLFAVVWYLNRDNIDEYI